MRIAAGGSQDEIVASHPLQSPAPDRSVDLDVTVLVEGAKHGEPLIKLHYPASGDGPWTPAVKFTAPRRKGTLTIYVTVQWKGRVLQSATLTGPLLAKVPLRRRKPALTLTVDESSSGLASPERQGADATMLQLPDAGSSPVLIDANSAAPIDPDVLAQAVRQVRRSLISTFLEPPTDLAGAAPRLADLAVRGSLLRDALRGRDDDFFDDATWIHVTSFGGSTIPFELIYTHPMPDLSSTVEVCGPALADASTCAGDCAERTRTDRVCPFGFWGTSKIVERRQHTAHRADHTASEQRQVPVRTGGVVAVTDQANLDDPTAGSRIAAAITGFVAVGSGVTAANWTDLEQAVAETRNILCLVTHTIEPDDPEDDLAVELQLGGESRRLVAIDRRFFNPAARQPGPIVLALGCDTATIHASFATFVSRLHGFGAEVVVSAISQIPGKEVADFVERLMTSLDETLQQPGEHRFGAVMTAVRRETLRHGDVLALALTATGDGDVRIGAA